jgi:hypothetical protein
LKNIVEPAYKKYILALINNDPEKYIGYIPIDIAPWWDNNNTIDLVAFNNKNITFINILWDNAQIAKTKYKQLQQSASNYKTTLNKNYIIISKNSYINSMK